MAMANGLLLAEGGVETRPRRYSPDLVRVERRGPVLRPSPRSEGTFGIDLTAGCPHGCRFCYIRGLSRYPGEGRVLFDPHVARRLVPELNALAEPPRQVVLSPASDPLPPVRAVVRATLA